MVTTEISYFFPSKFQWGFLTPRTIFERNRFTFSALKYYSVFTQPCSMISVPFFHFSEHLFSLMMFVYQTLPEKDTFKESSVSTEFLPAQSVSNGVNCMLLLPREPQRTPVPLLQAGNSEYRSSVEKKPNSLYLMEFVPLILMMKSKYRYLSPGPDRHFEL